jgi:hypothetical protein
LHPEFFFPETRTSFAPYFCTPLLRGPGSARSCSVLAEWMLPTRTIIWKDSPHWLTTNRQQEHIIFGGCCECYVELKRHRIYSSIPGRVKRILSSPKCPAHPISKSMGARGTFYGAAWALNWIKSPYQQFKSYSENIHLLKRQPWVNPSQCCC